MLLENWIYLINNLPFNTTIEFIIEWINPKVVSKQKIFGFVETKNEIIEQVFAIWNEIDNSLLEYLTDSKKID